MSSSKQQNLLPTPAVPATPPCLTTTCTQPPTRQPGQRQQREPNLKARREGARPPQLWRRECGAASRWQRRLPRGWMTCSRWRWPLCLMVVVRWLRGHRGRRRREGRRVSELRVGRWRRRGLFRRWRRSSWRRSIRRGCLIRSRGLRIWWCRGSRRRLIDIRLTILRLIRPNQW